jgi:hypothetical protein
MPTYHVSLSIGRPPNLSDREMMDLFRQAVDRAMCFAIEVTASGLIVECEAASLDVLEMELRTTLERAAARLERLTVRRI